PGTARGRAGGARRDNRRGPGGRRAAPWGAGRGAMNAPGPRRLLTFRLDTERRQRLRARLAREGRTMSEVVTHGLRQYVPHARHRDAPETTGTLVLPERIAARLRELRSSGRSELLSAGCGQIAVCVRSAALRHHGPGV